MSKNVAPRYQPSQGEPISEIRPSHASLARQLQLGEIEVSYEDDDVGTMPDYSRLQLDSSDMTHVKTPNPALLAMARGEAVKRPSRRTWFALGMFTGAVAMWLVIGDVQPAANAIRLLTTRATQTLDPGADRAPAPTPAQTSTPAATPASPPTSAGATPSH